MAVSHTTFSTKPPKSHDNLKVDLKVTVMLNYWNQFIKPYTEILSTISLSPMGRGEGGRLHTRYTENCEWWWYSRWPVVSPTSRYFRLRPLKSFTLLNVRSFRSHSYKSFRQPFSRFPFMVNWYYHHWVWSERRWKGLTRKRNDSRRWQTGRGLNHKPYSQSLLLKSIVHSWISMSQRMIQWCCVWRRKSVIVSMEDR